MKFLVKWLTKAVKWLKPLIGGFLSTAGSFLFKKVPKFLAARAPRILFLLKSKKFYRMFALYAGFSGFASNMYLAVRGADTGKLAAAFESLATTIGGSFSQIAAGLQQASNYSPFSTWQVWNNPFFSGVWMALAGAAILYLFWLGNRLLVETFSEGTFGSMHIFYIVLLLVVLVWGSGATNSIVGAVSAIDSIVVDKAAGAAGEAVNQTANATAGGAGLVEKLPVVGQ